MSSRYQNNRSKKLKNGKTVFRSKRYPKIPKRDSDIYVVTKGGDRLDTLANQFYSDSSLWWIIAASNNIHDAPFALKEGTIIRIPIDKNTILNNFYE